MNTTITNERLDTNAPATCARCRAGVPPDALFCPGCGLPAGFVPVVVAPAPPRSGRQRALAVLAGLGGALAAVAGFAGIILWIAGSAMSSGSGDDGDLRAVDVSADGRLVMAASRQGRVTLWDVETGYPVRTLDTGDRGVAAFAPSGWRFATGDRAGCAVNVWNAETGGRVAQLAPAVEPEDARTGTLALAFAPDGGAIAAGCQNGSVTVWSVENGTALFTVAAHTGEVRSLVFAPDGKSLYTGGADGAARRWSLPGGAAGATYTGLQGPVASLALTPDGARLLGATDGVRGDERIFLWDTATAGVVSRLDWERGMAPVALSPDGSLLATSSLGTIAVIGRQDGAAVRRLELPGDGGSVAALAFSPDGRWLVAVGEERVAVLWNPATGDLVRRLRP